MSETNWLPIVASLFGGGAVGALITAAVTTHRARIQPVGRRIDILPVFNRQEDASGLAARLVITHEGKTSEFENLFLAEVRIVNKGNVDRPKFAFGGTLQNGDQCIYVKPQTSDRHHQVTVKNAISPDSPQTTFDVELEPFNRGDAYALTLYLNINRSSSAPSEILLGSAAPVKFEDVPAISELLVEAATEVLKIGGLTVRIR